MFLFTHYLGNRLLTLLTNVLYNTMLTDMETCYKVMRTEVLRSFDAAVERVRHRARADGEDLQARSTGCTRCPSPMTGAGTTRARRSPGGTAWSPSGCCCGTGSASEPPPPACSATRSPTAGRFARRRWRRWPSTAARRRGSAGLIKPIFDEVLDRQQAARARRLRPSSAPTC
ncbi:MAG: hypothetical protein MZV64_73060 [Ignavibacteriales bacterium]|nr:hypothetical protein [Ignavibacteriales bacterium]